MNSFRFVWLIILVGCLMNAKALWADDAISPFALSKQYSADQVITLQDGTALTNKIYMDDGKIRTEMTERGIPMVYILRPDLKKVYAVLVSQKVVIEIPYNAEKFKKYLPPTTSADGKFETVGLDTVDGVVCTKYKFTSNDNHVFFMWVDTTKNIPVKMVNGEGTLTMTWNNYVTGPQDPSLFEPPAGYQTMAMPTMPGAPGGGGQ